MSTPPKISHSLSLGPPAALLSQVAQDTILSSHREIPDQFWGLRTCLRGRLRWQAAALDQHDDIWALSCIGAWVGIIYNQCDRGREPEQTRKFFREKVYRDDLSYSRFPINAIFGPDIVALTRATVEFLADIENYRNIVLPGKMLDFVRQAFLFSVDPTRWNQGDLSKLALEFNAAHPATRFLTSLMFLSNFNGLSKMYYNSTFLNSIDFERIKEPDKPFIFHNAFNLATKKVELFANRMLDPPKLKSNGITWTVGSSGVPVVDVLRRARRPERSQDCSTAWAQIG